MAAARTLRVLVLKSWLRPGTERNRDGEWVLWWIRCIHRGCIVKITPYQPVNTLKAAVFAAER